MLWAKRVSKVFRLSEEIPIDDSSKIVLMSDCHRGDGGFGDNFSKNENNYIAALDYYYHNGYTYIEIGDGDELWEVRNFKHILEAHEDVFMRLSKFYRENRLYFIYGNHDMVKKYDKFIENNLYYYFNEYEKEYVPLFPNIEIHEGLVLKYKATGHKIFLIHGHQAEILNNHLWRLARFLVRYLWRPLELHGVNNPTRTAKNHKKKDKLANKLTKWVIMEKQMLISGHNHMPMFPEVGYPPYFNDGSCVHPRCITGIEIVNGSIMLVRWCTKVNIDGILFVERQIIGGPRKLKDYFNTRRIRNEPNNRTAKKQEVSESI